MFNFFKNEDKDRIEPFELVMEADVFEKLKQRAQKDNISESRAMTQAIERGMRDYWLHVAKEDSIIYDFIMNTYHQYQKDNDVLEALIAQNNRLFEILDKCESKIEEHGDIQ